MRYVICTAELYNNTLEQERMYFRKKGARETRGWTSNINLASVFVCKKDAERRLAKILDRYGTGQIMEYERLLVEEIMET